MRAVVLVGGFGTRLRPLTLDLPKQMLPLCGAPMIERVVEPLAAQGVTEVVLSLGYRPDCFAEAYPDGRCAGVRLRYAVEPEPLDTAGAIAFAARTVGVGETFLALNGDVLTDLDVRRLVRFHRDHGGDATIALTPVEDPSRFGVVPTDGDGRVEAFVEKPAPGTAPSRWINAGAYVLEPQVLNLVPDGRRCSIERETFPRLVEGGRLFALQSTAYWLDAGTPEAYLQAHLDLMDGRRGAAVPCVAPEAQLAADATVRRSAVGAGAAVAGGASVVDSVLMDGVVVGEGAVVERSIVGARSVVGAGASLGDLTVVGFDRKVADGASLRAALVPPAEEWE